MKQLFIALFVLVAIAATSRADIEDQINACRGSGGANGCVYDLLSQMARMCSSGGHDGGGDGSRYRYYCACDGDVFYGVNYHRVSVETGDDVTLKKLSSDSQYNNLSECQQALSSYPQCRN